MCQRCKSMSQVGNGNENIEDDKNVITPQNKNEDKIKMIQLQHTGSATGSGFQMSADKFTSQRDLSPHAGQNITYCKDCAIEQKKAMDEAANGKKSGSFTNYNNNILHNEGAFGGNPTQKLRYNEKEVGPIFDGLFRNVMFKVIEFGQSSDMTGNGEMVEVPNRYGKDIHFMNDFLIKQMEYWQNNGQMGNRERIFIKIYENKNQLTKKTIELNMVKLDNESQVLFLFKEVSIYNRLQKARTTERFTNLLINSIAHNLFTPLNALIHLNKSLSNLVKGKNQAAEYNSQMISQCLQQLVFTSHNILEMSKIRQGKFVQNEVEVNIHEKLEQLFSFFKDDMSYREIEYEIQIVEKLQKYYVMVDDYKFTIVLYNLISNSVKHTNGGHIKVSIKLLDHEKMVEKLEKVGSKKRAMEQQKHALKWMQDGTSASDDENSLSSFQSKMISTQRRNDEISDNEFGHDSKKNQKIYLSVSVTDTGVGMDDYVQKNCFALFGNLKFKNNINQGGIGLGLTASNLICQALNGSLNLIRSELNNGSKFNFIMRIHIGSEIKIDNIKTQDENGSGSVSVSGESKEIAYDNDAQITRKQSLLFLEETLKQTHKRYPFDSHDSFKTTPSQALGQFLSQGVDQQDFSQIRENNLHQNFQNLDEDPKYNYGVNQNSLINQNNQQMQDINNRHNIFGRGQLQNNGSSLGGSNFIPQFSGEKPDQMLQIDQVRDPRHQIQRDQAITEELDSDDDESNQFDEEENFGKIDYDPLNGGEEFGKIMKHKKFGFKLRKGAKVPPQHFIAIAYADAQKSSSPSNNREDQDLKSGGSGQNSPPKDVNSVNSQSSSISQHEEVEGHKEDSGVVSKGLGLETKKQMDSSKIDRQIKALPYSSNFGKQSSKNNNQKRVSKSENRPISKKKHKQSCHKVTGKPKEYKISEQESKNVDDTGHKCQDLNQRSSCDCQSDSDQGSCNQSFSDIDRHALLKDSVSQEKVDNPNGAEGLSYDMLNNAGFRATDLGLGVMSKQLKEPSQKEENGSSLPSNTAKKSVEKSPKKQRAIADDQSNLANGGSRSQEQTQAKIKNEDEKDSVKKQSVMSSSHISRDSFIKFLNGSNYLEDTQSREKNEKYNDKSQENKQKIEQNQMGTFLNEASNPDNQTSDNKFCGRKQSHSMNDVRALQQKRPGADGQSQFQNQNKLQIAGTASPRREINKMNGPDQEYRQLLRSRNGPTFLISQFFTKLNKTKSSNQVVDEEGDFGRPKMAPMVQQVQSQKQQQSFSYEQSRLAPNSSKFVENKTDKVRKDQQVDSVIANQKTKQRVQSQRDRNRRQMENNGRGRVSGNIRGVQFDEHGRAIIVDDSPHDYNSQGDNSREGVAYEYDQEDMDIQEFMRLSSYVVPSDIDSSYISDDDCSLIKDRAQSSSVSSGIYDHTPDRLHPSNSKKQGLKNRDNHRLQPYSKHNQEGTAEQLQEANERESSQINWTGKHLSSNDQFGSTQRRVIERNIRARNQKNWHSNSPDGATQSRNYHPTQIQIKRQNDQGYQTNISGGSITFQGNALNHPQRSFIDTHGHQSPNMPPINTKLKPSSSTPRYDFQQIDQQPRHILARPHLYNQQPTDRSSKMVIVTRETNRKHRENGTTSREISPLYGRKERSPQSTFGGERHHRWEEARARQLGDRDGLQFARELLGNPKEYNNRSGQVSKNIKDSSRQSIQVYQQSRSKFGRRKMEESEMDNDSYNDQEDFGDEEVEVIQDGYGGDERDQNGRGRWVESYSVRPDTDQISNYSRSVVKAPNGNKVVISKSPKQSRDINQQFIRNDTINSGTRNLNQNQGYQIIQVGPGSSKPQEEEPQILIVDDTVFNIKCLAAQLEQMYNLKSDNAISGEEAIIMCQCRVARGQDAYRLIFMDINMPIMDGVVATKQIRAFTDDYVQKRKQKHYMIVAHTAIPEEQFGDFKEAGFDGFHAKAGDESENRLRDLLKKVDLL